MEKCDYCSAVIRGGKYYSIDMWGQKYHTHHHYSIQEVCSCCQCILMPGKAYLNIGGGYKICTYCKKEAILNKIQFQKCINGVLEFYEMGKLNLPLQRIKYELFDVTDLPSGVRGQVVFNGIEYRVQMMKGLSKTVFCGILVHEIMHIVLLEGGYNFSLQETEGLCELASFFAYQFMRNHVAIEWIERMNKSRDPIYGEGFREMMNRVRPYGSIQKFLNNFQNDI